MTTCMVSFMLTLDYGRKLFLKKKMFGKGISTLSMEEKVSPAIIITFQADLSQLVRDTQGKMQEGLSENTITTPTSLENITFNQSVHDYSILSTRTKWPN